MTKEKAIEILSHHKTFTFGDVSPRYGGSVTVEQIIDMLQDRPVKPVVHPETKYHYTFYTCGECGADFGRSIQKYCHICGRKVDQEIERSETN